MSAGCPQHVCSAGNTTSTPGRFEHAHRGRGRVGKHLVGDARDEQCDLGHRSTLHGHPADPDRPHRERRRVERDQIGPRAGRDAAPVVQPEARVPGCAVSVPHGPRAIGTPIDTTLRTTASIVSVEPASVPSARYAAPSRSTTGGSVATASVTSTASARASQRELHQRGMHVHEVGDERRHEPRRRRARRRAVRARGGAADPCR